MSYKYVFRIYINSKFPSVFFFGVKAKSCLNVLVGENNSGKTSLIDAIRLVLGTNSFDRTNVSESDFFENSSLLTIQLKFANVQKHVHVFVEHLTHDAHAKSRQ